MKNKIIVFLIGLFFCFFILELSLRTIPLFYSGNENHYSKNPNEIVIMTVGNSYTFEIGAPPGKSYSNYLENFLNNRNQRIKYRVVNKGILSANTTYILEKLEDWFKTYSPDYVFFMVGEPNNWNKYGYWKFHNKNFTNLESPNYFNKSLLNFSDNIKTVKFLKYLLNRNIKNPSNELGHSTLFKELKLNDHSPYFIGYLWIGGLSGSTIGNIWELNKTQLNEAEKYISYVFNKDNNYIAGFYLSIIYKRKGAYEKAFLTLEKAINSLDRFDLLIYQELENFKIGHNKELEYKLNDLKMKFKSRIDSSELDSITKNYSPLKRTMNLNFSDKKEELIFVKNVLKYNPTFFTALFYVYQQLLNNKSNQDDLIYITSIFEDALRINPFMFNHDFLSQYQKIGRINSEVNNRYNKFKLELYTKFDKNEIESFYEFHHFEKEWIIYDLEEMIKLSKKYKSKVIVQTYPPFRDGTTRPADAILREWWNNRILKDDIIFSDLNLKLTPLFDLNKGGEQYYSKLFGKQDGHQNEFGNIEIAKTMLQYVE